MGVGVMALLKKLRVNEARAPATPECGVRNTENSAMF